MLCLTHVAHTCQTITTGMFESKLCLKSTEHSGWHTSTQGLLLLPWWWFAGQCTDEQFELFLLFSQGGKKSHSNRRTCQTRTDLRLLTEETVTGPRGTD